MMMMMMIMMMLRQFLRLVMIPRRIIGSVYIHDENLYV